MIWSILVAMGAMLAIFSIAVLVIGTVRHFFPMVEPMIPESFKKGLSFQYGSYYLLAGLLLILLGSNLD